MLEWLDRNWNLYFHKERCFRILVYREAYGSIYTRKNVHKGELNTYRCMGKGWYKLIGRNKLA